jgi:hypothetical protein
MTRTLVSSLLAIASAAALAAPTESMYRVSVNAPSQDGVISQIFIFTALAGDKNKPPIFNRRHTQTAFVKDCKPPLSLKKSTDTVTTGTEVGIVVDQVPADPEVMAVNVSISHSVLTKMDSVEINGGGCKIQVPVVNSSSVNQAVNLKLGEKVQLINDGHLGIEWSIERVQ